MKLLTILRKNIPLSLKMSASGRLRPQTSYTGASPLDPTGDFCPQTRYLVESKKSLNYTMRHNMPQPSASGDLNSHSELSAWVVIAHVNKGLRAPFVFRV